MRQHSFSFPNPQRYWRYSFWRIFDSLRLNNSLGAMSICWYRSMLYCLRRLWFRLGIGWGTFCCSRNSLLGTVWHKCYWWIRQMYQWGMSSSSSKSYCLRNIILGFRGNCIRIVLLLCRGTVCGCNFLRIWMLSGRPKCCRLLLGIMLHSFVIRHLQSSKLRLRFGTFLRIFWSKDLKDAWRHKIPMGKLRRKSTWCYLRKELCL